MTWKIVRMYLAASTDRAREPLLISRNQSKLAERVAFPLRTETRSHWRKCSPSSATLQKEVSRASRAGERTKSCADISFPSVPLERECGRNGNLPRAVNAQDTRPSLRGSVPAAANRARGPVIRRVCLRATARALLQSAAAFHGLRPPTHTISRFRARRAKNWRHAVARAGRWRSRRE